jgi:hypothetical protein
MDQRKLVASQQRTPESDESVQKTPSADIGVLLVHGIGDHAEGETLTSFGQPLIDSLQDWLGNSEPKENPRVTEARLKAVRNEAESPAYSVMRVSGTEKGVTSTESWLFCEAWWGESVQPPRPLNLLIWLWTRGPLLIFWHFYLVLQAISSAKPKVETLSTFRALQIFFRRYRALQIFFRRYFVQLPRIIWEVLLAISLAAFCQIVVSVAIALLVIPIGKWRRAVANAARSLTLSLGDSYVLLEHEIQRAALVERVRRSLSWLSERVDKILVVAHSQGAAIAHEALVQSETANVQLFISVGSGLEKLQFLRRMRETRRGIIGSALLSPVVAIAIALSLSAISQNPRLPLEFMSALTGGHEQTESAQLLLIIFFITIFLAGLTLTSLRGYKSVLTERIPSLKFWRTPRQLKWIDMNATHDLVPMGTGSLLKDQKFITPVEICNQRSFLHDHIGYFENRAGFLPAIWMAIAQASKLRLFTEEHVELLKRHIKLHSWQARVLSLTWHSTWLTALVGALALGTSIKTFGAWVLTISEEAAFGETFPAWKWFGTAVKFLGWLLNVEGKTVAAALLGGLILLVALVLWWIIFKAFWRLRTVANWLKACRRVDVLHTGADKLRYFATCSGLLALGSLPFSLGVGYKVAPNIFSAATAMNALRAAMAVLFLGASLFYAASMPWVYISLLKKRTLNLVDRVFDVLHPLVAIGMSFSFLITGVLFWPYLLSVPQQLNVLLCVALFSALAWQAYFVQNRKNIAVLWKANVLGLPLLAWGFFWLMGSAVAVEAYIITTAFLVIIALVVTNRELIRTKPEAGNQEVAPGNVANR